MIAGPMQARGRVIETHGDVADVRVAVAPSCHGCRARAVCADRGGQVIRIVAPANTAVGDPVLLELDQANFALGAAIGYLLPALTLLLGAAVSSLAGDTAAPLGAAIGLSTGLLLVRLLHRRLLADRLQPTASLPCPSQSVSGEKP